MTAVRKSRQYGWASSAREFLSKSTGEIVAELDRHSRESLRFDPVESQRIAWRDSIDVLRRTFEQLTLSGRDVSKLGVIFEYELPRERGRRPDVILLAQRQFAVLEFKGYPASKRAFEDQAEAYVRDLRSYHAGSHDLEGTAFLVLGGDSHGVTQRDGLNVVSGSHLTDALQEWVDQAEGISRSILDTWLEADYAPLPTLVAAARTIFNHEPLPHIRRAQSAGIPATLAALESIANDARDNGGHHLALITGVPGAGKTLVGLQFVYSTQGVREDESPAGVFLSGNGPLVKVLQHALRSKVFVQDVHGFLRQYGGEKRRLPTEQIWVYDEAQRAWDGARVLEKRGHGFSEPEDFVRIGSRMAGWALVVGLIGEGQEIHIGEEAGLGQWNDALSAGSVPWNVHCPPRVAGIFNKARSVNASATLDLDQSLRSHVAEDVQTWVKALLSGDVATAGAAAANASSSGFRFYRSRSINEVQEYVRDRYRGEEDKRYGWIASSKAKNLEPRGIHNGFEYTRRFREGPWFNDSPDSPDSCCQLDEVATEFQCQGLELDLPLVAWGDDLAWKSGSWRSRPSPRSKSKDPHQLRLNSYRVLLSRGRDGVAIYVPDDDMLDSTFDVLGDAGCETP